MVRCDRGSSLRGQERQTLGLNSLVGRPTSLGSWPGLPRLEEVFPPACLRATQGHRHGPFVCSVCFPQASECKMGRAIENKVQVRQHSRDHRSAELLQHPRSQ